MYLHSVHLHGMVLSWAEEQLYHLEIAFQIYILSTTMDQIGR